MKAIAPRHLSQSAFTLADRVRAVMETFLDRIVEPLETFLRERTLVTEAHLVSGDWLPLRVNKDNPGRIN